MPEPAKFSLKESALADGTIDFYTMLNEPEDATAEGVKAKINSLYSEAQANRDHRNLTRRREYQTLLEMLPWAKAALLDVEKRQRYDAYLAAARSGTNSPDFETFMDDLMGVNDDLQDGKTGLPTIKDKSSDTGPRVIKAPVQQSTKTPAKQAPSVSGGSKAGAPPVAIIGAVIGLIAGGALGYIIKGDPVIAALFGLILAAVAFVVLNKKPKGKVGV